MNINPMGLPEHGRSDVNSDMPANRDAIGTVRLLGRVNFASTRKGDRPFRALLPEGLSTPLRLLILFDAKEYPLESHYVYASHRGGGAPYTFPNMDFNAAPPGIRVGPWPHWRGIPGFPPVTLSIGGAAFPVTMMPWGDELTTRRIRGSALFESPVSGELLCTVADRRLRPIRAELYACQEANVTAEPISLRSELLDTHPRLLFTSEEIPLLRQRASGSHRSHWERITRLLEDFSLPFEITPESKVLPGPERLRAEDKALLSALMAIVEPSPAHQALARDSFLTFVHETQRPDYQPLMIDTQAGETLCMLSLCLDWTHELYSDEQRKELRLWLWKVADICWSHLGYERRDYAQAHYLGCALGLLAFSLLFWEDHPRAKEWAGHCHGVLRTVMAMLPEDGFYPHGINLWIYEYGFLLRHMELLRVAAGIDLWKSTRHWQNASAFREAATSPDGLYGITFGDPQFRVGGDSWCHYLIGARTGSPHAQALGESLRDAPVAGVDFRSVPPRRRVYEFLYYDPVVPSQPAEPTITVFGDGGQAFVRQRTERPSVFTFRSGPPLGQQRYLAGEYGGYGHADPCNGSFLLFQENSFAISGPGPTYRRDTSLHNIITIDRQGQIGDSTVWLPEFLPPEFIPPPAEYRDDGGCLTLSAPLTRAYLPHLKVDECHRSLWIDPGRTIVGVDTIRCTGRHTIEWNIHTAAPAEPVQGSPVTAFTIQDPAGSFRLVFLDPVSPHWETGTTEMVPAYPHDGTRMMYLCLPVEGRKTRFIWYMVFGDTARGGHWRLEGGRLFIHLEGELTLIHDDGFLRRVQLA